MRGYCPDIENGLAIDFKNGQIQIGSCCSTDKFDVGSNAPIDSYLKHPKLIEIKQENRKNYIPDDYCRTCVDIERIGQKSRRVGQIENIKSGFFTESKDNALRRVDFNTGNLCNLKCSICNPRWSTAWIPDSLKLGHADRWSQYNLQDSIYYKKHEKFVVNDPSIFENLEFVRLYGGESLMNDIHYDFLKMLDDIGILGNVFVQYSTNGTFRVSDDVLKIWEKAKTLHMYFSIDDIGERFEYQRFGANWDKVVENLYWFDYHLGDNRLLETLATVSYLNICNLKNLLSWHESNFPIKIDFQPAWNDLSMEKITQRQKNLLIERLPRTLRHYADFPAVVEEHDHKKVFDYLDSLDNIRNTNWRKTFPELVDIFEQHT